MSKSVNSMESRPISLTFQPYSKPPSPQKDPSNHWDISSTQEKVKMAVALLFLTGLVAVAYYFLIKDYNTIGTAIFNGLGGGAGGAIVGALIMAPLYVLPATFPFLLMIGPLSPLSESQKREWIEKHQTRGTS